MIERMARGMAYFYVRNEYIPAEELEAHRYGFEILLSTLCNIVLVLGLSVLFQSTPESCLYLIVFVLLRSVGGGYHAQNHKSCIAVFTVLYALFSLVILKIDSSAVLAYIYVFAAITLAVLLLVAPVESPNKPLSEKKRTRLKRRCALAGAGTFFVALGTFFLPQDFESSILYLFSGAFAAAMSMAAAAIRLSRRKKEHA